MGKEATTVDEQIAKLSERGMNIDNKVKAKENLSDIGYFRLGFYCFPFEITYPKKKNRTHDYKEGSNFKDVVDLYYLDDRLRNLLHRYINRIEINFRTSIIYIVSNFYKNDNIWFVDNSVVDREFIDIFEDKIIGDKTVRGIYSQLKEREKLIQEHHQKHRNDRYAYAWKTLEFLSFGQMVKLYRNLKNKEIKKEIANKYGIKNIGVFENYLNSIVEIRNICAHCAVLFDHQLSRRLSKGPASKGEESNLYSVIKVIQFILKHISNSRVVEMTQELSNWYNDVDKNEVIRRVLQQCSGDIKENIDFIE